MGEWARASDNGASSEASRNFITSAHFVWHHTDADRAEAAAPPEILPAKKRCKAQTHVAKLVGFFLKCDLQLGNQRGRLVKYFQVSLHCGHIIMYVCVTLSALNWLIGDWKNICLLSLISWFHCSTTRLFARGRNA